MIEQIFRITVSGVVITTEVSGCSISEQMQRIYNTASFVSDDNIVTKEIIKIELGDKVFDGFIYSSTKNGKNTYNIECRTFAGYMTTPFIADDTSIVIPVKTSHELCAYYADEYGIPIIITAIDLNFGGDYEQKGTPLSALVSVAHTTGADYWFDGTSIRIEPAKWIEEQGEEVLTTDIIDYEPFAKTIDQRGVGTVVVGTSGTDTDKTATLSCNSKIDGCTSLATIRVIPHDAYQYSEGLSSEVEVQTPMSYIGIISMQSYLTLEADIVSISEVKVNNSVVSDYSFVNNTIIFTSPKRGRVTVDYVGWGYTGYADTKTIDGDKIASFTVFYGECEAYYYDGVISCDKGGSGTTTDDGGAYNNCGGVIVKMPDANNYVKGFSFSTFEETPFIYFYDGVEILASISVESSFLSSATLEPASLSQYDGGGEGVRHKLRLNSDNVSGVQSMGVDIAYTSDADYVYLTKMYQGVVVSYNSLNLTHKVSGPNIPDSEVKMVIAGPLEGDQCEYPLSGADANDPNSMSCSLGDDVPVDIVGIHGISLESVKGKNFLVLPPGGEAGVVYIADDFGVIVIEDVKNGGYFIDTGEAWPNSYIKMISYAV